MLLLLHVVAFWQGNQPFLVADWVTMLKKPTKASSWMMAARPHWLLHLFGFAPASATLRMDGTERF